MKPAHSNQMNVLMTSIENSSSEMENSDIETVNTGPNALFQSWIKQANAIEVMWGDTRTAIRDEVIFTQHMSDCSSVVICANYDGITDTYGQRSLMHITGSSIHSREATWQIFNLLRMAYESSGTPKCIIALGSNVTHEQFSTIENQCIKWHDKKEYEPFKILQEWCDTTIVAKNNGIAVRPDGSYALMRPQRYPHQG